MLSDIEIALSANMQPIEEVASKIGIERDELEFYGKYKAKLPLGNIEKRKNNPDGKLVLVTAMNPTPAGEGKTTVSIGLAQALNKKGKKEEPAPAPEPSDEVKLLTEIKDLLKAQNAKK